MKKVLLTMLGVAGMLCSTSCSDEEIVSNVEGDAMVQFTVELSDGSDASRAISDGLSVDELYYEVYSVKDGVATLMPNLDAKVDMDVVNGVNTATVRLALVKGQAYDVVFWAQKPGAYDATDLQNITVAPTTANNEDKDAFTAVYRTAKVTGPIKETIVLTRPFAQVNFGTLDVEAAKKAGITFSESQIVVSNAASTYNALTEQAAATGSELTFGFAKVPDMEKEALVVSGTTYEYLATAYVLVPGDSTQKLSDLKVEIETGLNEIITLSVPNAPVQRNFRTNVLGNLLTNTAEFNIVVDPIYKGDYNPIDMLNKVLTEGGEFKLFSDIVLTEPITIPAGVDAKIDLNECTMTVNSSNRVEGSLTLSNGNLNIDVAGEGDLKSAFTARNGSTVSLDGVNVSVADKSAAVYVPNSSVEATVNISNTTMSIAGAGHGVTAPEGAKNLAINVEESTLTGKYAFYLMNSNSVVTIDDKSSVKDFWVMGGNVTVVYEGNKPEIKTDGLAVTITYYTKDEYALKQAFENGGNVTLTSDITLTEALTISDGDVANIDLGGNTLTVNEKAVVAGELNISNGEVVVDMSGRGSAFEAVGANAKVDLENVTVTVKGNNNAITIESAATNPDAQAIINIDNTKINVEGNNGHAIFVTHFVKYLEVNVTNNSEVTGNQAIFIEKATEALVNIDETSYVEKVIALYGNVKVVCKSNKSPIIQGGGDFEVEQTVSDATTLETALSNATPGSTIVLSGATATDYGTVEVGDLKDVTIEGDGNTVMIFKTTADTKIENVTLKKINFEYTGATADCGIVLDANAQIDNLVVENCDFVGTGAKAGRGLAYPNENASIVFKNCKFKDLGYPIWAFGGYESLIVEGCTFENIKSWAIMPQSGFDGDLTVTGCNFVNCLGGGLVKAGTLTAGHTFTFTDNVITGCTIAGDHNWFQFNVSAGITVISGNTKDGQAWEPGVAEGLKR